MDYVDIDLECEDCGREFAADVPVDMANEEFLIAMRCPVCTLSLSADSDGDDVYAPI